MTVVSPPGWDALCRLLGAEDWESVQQGLSLAEALEGQGYPPLRTEVFLDAGGSTGSFGQLLGRIRQEFRSRAEWQLLQGTGWLKGATTLSLTGWQSRAPGALAGCTSVESLWLGYGADLEALRELPHPERVTTFGACVGEGGLDTASLVALQRLVNVQTVTLDRSWVEDLRPLGELKCLRELRLRRVQSLRDGLSAVGALHRTLEWLDVGYMDTWDDGELSFLAGCTRLRRLDLDMTKARDLSPLKGLPGLSHLSARGCPLEVPLGKTGG